MVVKKEWVLLLVVAGCTQRTFSPGILQHHGDSIRWQDAPPNLPPGAKSAILEGDPRSGGMFTMRLSVPAGYALPRHSHDGDERVTVLSGRACVTIETEECFEAGSFYLTPARIPHSVRFPDATVLQATGIGPWTYQPL